VDHPLAAPSDALRPWRATALVASALAGAELVALVIFGAVLLGKSLNHSHAKTVPVVRASAPLVHHRTARTRAASAAPTLTRHATSVLVLNGNGISGAAGQAAARVRGLGYMVGGVGNATRPNAGGSVIMYRAGFRPEALRLARDLRVRAVGPLDGLRTSDLMGAHLAYVLG
jgi:hypothetical protein